MLTVAPSKWIAKMDQFVHARMTFAYCVCGIRPLLFYNESQDSDMQICPQDRTSSQIMNCTMNLSESCRPWSTLLMSHAKSPLQCALMKVVNCPPADDWLFRNFSMIKCRASRHCASSSSLTFDQIDYCQENWNHIQTIIANKKISNVTFPSAYVLRTAFPHIKYCWKKKTKGCTWCLCVKIIRTMYLHSRLLLGMFHRESLVSSGC